jgi:hypothetical protein
VSIYVFGETTLDIARDGGVTRLHSMDVVTLALHSVKPFICIWWEPQIQSLNQQTHEYRT